MQQIPLLDLVLALSSAADLVSPAVANHHKRVAFIAFNLATDLELDAQDTQDVVVASALHDMGAFSIKERMDLLEFEIKHPHKHARQGYLFFRKFAPFAVIAQIIRFHHVNWDDGFGKQFDNTPVPMLSHLVHLADRIDILAAKADIILAEVPNIVATIEKQRNKMFAPQHVDAFLRVAKRESFWLDLQYPALDDVIKRSVDLEPLMLSSAEMISMARMLSHLIDFKSPFTSAHTAGVAACSETLARLAGIPEESIQQVVIAGYLHDLGKLAVPAEILEKPQKLSGEEFDVMKAHAYYTRRILDSIGVLESTAEWASSHHERLDGKGYPFRRENISLCARIIAVADVYTAISEDRPYRKGMSREEVQDVLEEMARNSKLDPQIVEMLVGNMSEIEAVRIKAQNAARNEYEELLASAE